MAAIISNVRQAEIVKTRKAFKLAEFLSQENCIGNQTGGRVFLFLHTDDFRRDFHDMKACGVKFIEEPRTETYGTVVVFEDLYGNKWDLLELKTPETLAYDILTT